MELRCLGSIGSLLAALAVAGGLLAGGCIGPEPPVPRVVARPTASQTPSLAAIAPGFHAQIVLVQHREYRYRVYIPPGYTPARTWPTILFLHGSGACGMDGVAPTQGALGEVLQEHPDRYPCLVVFPQARDIDYWTGSMDDMAMAALEQTIQRFHGDRLRLYLTGYSMGGAGTWFLAARHPGVFAALAPVCGRVAIQPSRAHSPDLRRRVSRPDPFASIASRIGKTPVWVFHGSADPVVPVTESRRIVAAIRANRGNVRYTEYLHVGHDAWDNAYADPALPRWLLGRTSLSPGMKGAWITK